MSITDLIKNAKTEDFFKELSDSEKKEIDLKGKIAAAILNKRHELKMNQSEFADYMKVSQAMISKWESGEYNFSCDSIAKLKKINIFLTVNDEKLIKDSINETDNKKSFKKFLTTSECYKNIGSTFFCYETKYIPV